MYPGVFQSNRHLEYNILFLFNFLNTIRILGDTPFEHKGARYESGNMQSIFQTEVKQTINQLHIYYNIIFLITHPIHIGLTHHKVFLILNRLFKNMTKYYTEF